MSIKNLGWIALGGFVVGFVSLGAAYAAGGKERLQDIPGWFGNGWIGDIVWHGRCRVDDKAETIERRWAWNGSDAVNIAVPGSIRYKVGEGTEIVARGPAELLDRIRVEDESIGLTCNAGRTARNLEVILPGQAFREINLAGSGDLVGENINQEQLSINIAGSGSVRAVGSAEDVEVSIAGSADAKLGDLKIERLEVNIAGSGNAEAGPTEEVEVNVMGSGDLKLLSNPKKVETNIMGSGRIVRAGPKETGI